MRRDYLNRAAERYRDTLQRALDLSIELDRQTTAAEGQVERLRLGTDEILRRVESARERAWYGRMGQR